MKMKNTWLSSTSGLNNVQIAAGLQTEYESHCDAAA